MSTAELQIVYEPDEDGTGKVIASAKAGPFSAKGAAWFGRDLDTFLKRLRSYPLSSEKPPMIEGGYYDDKGSLKQCHVRIVIRPHDLRGRLLVQAELTSEVWSMTEAIVPNSASIRFLTEYAVLERFAAEFEELLKGRRQVAILTGDHELKISAPFPF